MIKKNKFLLILFVIIGAIVVFWVLLSVWASTKIDNKAVERMRQIINEKDDKKQQAAMKRLALDEGVEAAIALLNSSALPKGGPTHLLAHKIGEAAYEKYGEEALVHCQNDMLNGCTHGLILEATLKGGFENVKQLARTCKKYSPFQYHMCLHGAGHALLTLAGYHIAPALANCDDLLASGAAELIHCYNGVFMENALGEHEGLVPPLHPDLSTKNLLRPCDEVQSKYRQACYFNQPSWWAWVHGNDIEKISRECAYVPSTFQDECADGVGRVLVTVVGVDIKAIVQGCGFLGNALSGFCVDAISKAQFGLGDRQTPFALCAALSENEKPRCYGGVVSLMKEYGLSSDEFASLCVRVETSFRNVCAN